MARESAKGVPTARVKRPDETTISLLRMLYVTEIYSAETFGHFLEAHDGLTADQRRKYEACRRLELAMSRSILHHLTSDLRLTVKPPPRARQAAETLATPMKDFTWAERMTELEGGCIRGVTAFRTLRSLYGAAQPHLCATQLAHQLALRDFARDELDGDHDVSLWRILNMLGDEDRAAVTAFEA